MNDNIFERMITLVSQGFMCAQIPLILTLEAEGEENSELVRALTGLNLGFNDTSGPCGALLGGCSMISYFAGKGDELELEDPAFKRMISEYTSWFREQYGSQICTELIEGDMKNTLERCPALVEASYIKAREILESNGLL